MNIEGARLAREACDEVTAETGRKRYVAGALGPTGRSAAVATKDDPAERDVTFDELVVSYQQQIDGLTRGGVHIIFIETIFDTLNSKAAMMAYSQYFDDKPEEDRLPLFISATLIDISGRNLSG